MKIIIAGSSGLIGRRLVEYFNLRGDLVISLVRRSPQNDSELFYSLTEPLLDLKPLEAADLFINLCGENIASSLWTKAKRKRIKQSRLDSSGYFCKLVSSLKCPPKVVFSASAIGYYGNRGEERLTESSKRGEGFLPELAEGWEACWTPLIDKGVSRVIFLRFGIVLSNDGGMLGKMLPVFRYNLGGRMGTGRQMLSWIGIDEIPEIISFLSEKNISGPVNIVSSFPVSNKTFTSTLAEVLGKIAIFHIPGIILKALPGSMGQELFLTSANVEPAALTKLGFSFKHLKLTDVLKDLITNSGPNYDR